MTRTCLALLVLGTVGCSTTESQFDHRADLAVNARGVALNQDGLRGQVGMFGTTCAVDTRTATIGTDLDFEDGDENVQDASIVGGEDVILVRSDSGLHLQAMADAFDVAEPTIQGDFRDGRLFDDGAVGLEQETLWWTTGGSAPVPGLTDFDVDADGAAWVAAGSLSRVTPDGTIAIADGIARIAHDRGLDALYAVAPGSSVLEILETDGTLRTSVDLSGEIVGLDDMGDRGDAILVVAHEDGTGELVMVDGITGEIAAWVGTPTPAESVRSSGDGSAIAITLPGAIHFFGVE